MLPPAMLVLYFIGIFQYYNVILVSLNVAYSRIIMQSIHFLNSRNEKAQLYIIIWPDKP